MEMRISPHFTLTFNIDLCRLLATAEVTCMPEMEDNYLNIAILQYEQVDTNQWLMPARYSSHE